LVPKRTVRTKSNIVEHVAQQVLPEAGLTGYITRFTDRMSM